MLWRFVITERGVGL